MRSPNSVRARAGVDHRGPGGIPPRRRGRGAPGAPPPVGGGGGRLAGGGGAGGGGRRGGAGWFRAGLGSRWRWRAPRAGVRGGFTLHPQRRRERGRIPVLHPNDDVLTSCVFEPHARGQRAVKFGKALERLGGCGPRNAEPREHDEERGDRPGELREHARSAEQLTHRAPVDRTLSFSQRANAVSDSYLYARSP